MSSCNNQPLTALFLGSRDNTTSVPVHSPGKPRKMDKVSWRIAEMARNTDPDIMILLVEALLYIRGERNDLPQCLNINLHLDILRISWPSIIYAPILHPSYVHNKRISLELEAKKRD